MRRLAVDTGGTFTDFVRLDGDRVTTWKVPSERADPGAPIGEVCAADSPDALSIATTVGTNAILEGRLALTALVTTAGFEDLIDLKRQDRPRLYALEQPPFVPLVPAERRHGFPARVDAAGEALAAPTADDWTRFDAWLDDQVERERIEAVAILFLHAVPHPRHEEALLARIAARHPSLAARASHRFPIDRREFERLSATILSAGLLPILRRYLERIGLPGGRVMIGHSSGRLGSVDDTLAAPVVTVLSGPAAGAAGARRLAQALDLGPLVTLDMGGTSTDVAWIDPDAESLPLHDRVMIGGWPVALPAVDVVSVGAGGGSIARVDDAGALVVGPESAGADPGPAAYGRGGPVTVTDAALVGGLLQPESPGFPRALDPVAARRAVEHLGARLGATATDTARAILDLALARMARAIREASSARGHDPRRASLLAFGGAGPLFAGALAKALGMPRVLLPPGGGVFSAWGLLAGRMAADGKEAPLPPGEVVALAPGALP